MTYFGLWYGNPVVFRGTLPGAWSTKMEWCRVALCRQLNQGLDRQTHNRIPM